jgi:hypothetical protein
VRFEYPANLSALKGRGAVILGAGFECIEPVGNFGDTRGDDDGGVRIRGFETPDLIYFGAAEDDVSTAHGGGTGQVGLSFIDAAAAGGEYVCKLVRKLIFQAVQDR